MDEEEVPFAPVAKRILTVVVSSSSLEMMRTTNVVPRAK